jgi:hypothetical protein
MSQRERGFQEKACRCQAVKSIFLVASPIFSFADQREAPCLFVLGVIARIALLPFALCSEVNSACRLGSFFYRSGAAIYRPN